MAHQIFVGYRRVDQAAAASLVKAIEAQGYTVFWDADLVSGDEFHEALNAKIDTAKAAIILWSADMPAHTAVLMEAQRALRGKKLLLVAIDEDVKLFPAFRGLHFENLSPAAGGANGYWSRLSGNDNWDTHPNFHKLMTAIRRKVGKPQAQKDRERRNLTRAAIFSFAFLVVAAVAAGAYFNWGIPTTAQAPMPSAVDVADAAYLAAGDPNTGYTPELIENAIGKLESLRQLEPSNFTPERERRLQALQRRRDEPTFRDCDSCPVMTVVLASEPFAIAVFETSVAEWVLCAACVDPFTANARRGARRSTPDEPITWVRHSDIQPFLDDLRARRDREAGQFTYELPSAGEWLIAAGVTEAQAQGQAPFSVELPHAARDVCGYVNGLNSDRIGTQRLEGGPNESCRDYFTPDIFAPADPTDDGRFVANAVGLYHAIGNASEWSRDPCPDGQLRVLGGGRADPPNFEARRLFVPFNCAAHYTGHPNRGFRVMRAL